MIALPVRTTNSHADLAWTLAARGMADTVPGQSLCRLKRRHWIEISDEPWCPLAIRYAVTDYCRFVLAASKAYDTMAPILAEALRRTKTCHVLDLASGAAGPWVGLQPLLRSMGVDVSVCLTDHCPNVEAFERAHRVTQQAITYHPQPVDAAQVPSELSGLSWTSSRGSLNLDRVGKCSNQTRSRS